MTTPDPGKKMELFFTKNLNNSFITSKDDNATPRSQDHDDGKKGGNGGDLKRQKSNRTIMQQINSFALTPMNDIIAACTIEDHKYLLELVENRCAIAYFAAVNRNQCLFNALKRFHEEQKEKDADNDSNGEH